MFNLEKSIADWRGQMLAAGVKSPVPLDELENHLRDEIARQVKSGRSEMEGFESAVQKIGQPQSVRDEFKKVEALGEEREWKFKQILLVVLTGLISLCIGGMMLFRFGNMSAMSPTQQGSGWAAIAVFNLFVWGGRLGRGCFPVIRIKRIRDAVGFCGAVLCVSWQMAFFNFILPCFDFTIGQLMIAILWGFITPMGAFLGFIWGIETAARKQLAAR